MKKILEKSRKTFDNIEPLDNPAALISNHGCVVFGRFKRVPRKCYILEYIAELATSQMK